MINKYIEKLLDNFDYFGHVPKQNINQNKQYSTKLGIGFTFIVLVITTFFIYIFSSDMI
jgi:hypothetical protein